MSAESFDRLPETIRVREIKWRIRECHYRVREVTLVTTLLDPDRYPAAEIARLYKWRWQVEVNLRDLKITLGMDVLKGHSVDVVTKEVLVFVLIYNLVRLVMHTRPVVSRSGPPASASSTLFAGCNPPSRRSRSPTSSSTPNARIVSSRVASNVT